MGWRDTLGRASAAVVKAVAERSDLRPRGLDARERTLLQRVFDSALDLDAIRLCERVSGLINLSRRAYVIENTMFLPAAYVPIRDAVLVHESTHVWQFQHGGHAYIGDSLHAQLIGDGYDLEKGLNEGRSWAELNCEQQATLLERANEQGCFDGRPFVLNGVDFTAQFVAARDAVRAGAGAPR